MQTIEEIEFKLGPASEYVVHGADVPILREWAILKGHNPFDAHRMTVSELVNLYHVNAEKPSQPAPPFDVNDMVLKVLEAVNAPGFEVSMTRRIARSEMQQEIMSGEATKRLIQETLEALAPRNLIVTGPQGSVQLDGVLHYMTETVIKTVSFNHPTMLVGPAGCGKTTIGQHTARALNLPFYITSTINDTHELTGFIDGYGKYHSTPFRNAFEFGGVWVADEIDAWDASALLAANAALANGYSTFPDRQEPVARHGNFRMVATANTFGNGADRIYVGRNELDAASLDRFAMIYVGYDLNLERAVSNGNSEWLEYVWETRRKVEAKKIRHVVSTRAITMGSTALASGLKRKDVENFYLFKGMSETDREKLQ